MIDIFKNAPQSERELLNSAHRGALPLDDIDRALISALLEDGRMSFKAIGDRIGLTGDAASERYDRLLAHGVVRVIGVPHPASLGLNVAAAVTLSVTGSVSEVARQLVNVPNVALVATTFGSFDIVVEIVAADDISLFDTIEQHIRSIPSVRQSNALRFTNVMKWATRPSLHPAPLNSPFTLNDDDRQILRVLLQDGRASYKELADATGFQYAQVRRRSIALIESGVVQINTVVNRPAIGDAVMAGVMLRIAGRAIEEVAQDLAKISGVEVVISILGPYDLLLEIACPDMLHLGVLLASIRAVPGVVLSETFTYVRIERLPIQWGAHV